MPTFAQGGSLAVATLTVSLLVVAIPACKGTGVDDGVVPAVCGNGTLESGEGCDDGNTAPGDGCSSGCAVEQGWSCTTPPGGTTTCISLCIPPAAPAVSSGSSRKVCQLIGDVDRGLGTPTVNLTWTRCQLYGTDLGASFEHAGRLWFLFGDSVPESGNPSCGDSIATSPTSVDPLQCLPLTFQAQAGGSYRSPAVAGVDLGCFDVPLHGVSSGGTMYVWFSTACMTRSVLARSDDGGASFHLVHVLSDCSCGEACVDGGPPVACSNPSCRLVNVSAAVVPAASAGALPGTGDRLLLFGSGSYRRSDVYLAVTSLSTIEDPSALRYFAGTEAVSCTPSWSTNEADAVPIFRTAGEKKPGSCVGELSVHRSEILGHWIAMYNCGNRVDARIAPFPWGPWSAHGIVLDPIADGAYCDYLFKPDSGCDSLSDAGRLTTAGGVYGPYAIPRLTTATPAGATMYFTLSTWNPYNAILMRTEIVRPH